MHGEFNQLIEQVRRGDEAAVTRLIDEYGGAIRRAIRMQILDRRLRRVLGESDVFQSVFARFLLELWAGRYEFERPEQLAALLKKMALSKVTDAVRHHTAQCRDVRRTESPAADGELVAHRREPSPSQIVADRELLQAALQAFSAEEREILQLRQDRMGWIEIAARQGKSPEAVRKQLERAIDRVAEQLQLN